MRIRFFLSKVFCYWNTLRYLKFVQIIGRVSRKFKRPKVDLSLAGSLRKQIGVWVEPARHSQRMVGEHSFCFLNEYHNVISVTDWNNSQWNKLWLYNLHYFDDLTAVDADKRVDLHRALIQRWINENPPGKGIGWEPYPSSLRIVNWIKWGLAGNPLPEQWQHSLSVQVRYLIQNLETHLLGNHFFANAKALLFAGFFFRGTEADSWCEIGLRIVKNQLPKQVLSDGGNFELSTMYHTVFLEDLLDLVNIQRTYGRLPPSDIEERITAMFYWLDVMCHPDGEISFFNDSAFNATPSVDEVTNYGVRLSLFPFCVKKDRKKRLTDYFSYKKNSVLPDEFLNPVKGFLLDLPESGYSRVEMGDAVALIDRAGVGPDYLPGHAHADTFSFELSLFGQRMIVNSGTSVYGTGADRQWQRGTAAHSTVSIDGEDSSEVWGGFRVARRARVLNRKQTELDGSIYLSACHDGFKRLKNKPVHCRQWLFEENRLTIYDKIEGQGENTVSAVLVLHPEIKVINVDGNSAVLNVIEKEVVIFVEGKGLLVLENSNYHPEFGLSVKNSHLIFRGHSILPARIKTRISW